MDNEKRLDQESQQEIQCNSDAWRIVPDEHSRGIFFEFGKFVNQEQSEVNLISSMFIAKGDLDGFVTRLLLNLKSLNDEYDLGITFFEDDGNKNSKESV